MHFLLLSPDRHKLLQSLDAHILLDTSAVQLALRLRAAVRLGSGGRRHGQALLHQVGD